MTNLEALGGSVNYPVDETKLQKLLIDNGLNASDTYSGITKSFELATAGLYVLLVTSANISEGGYSVSMTDKSNMIKLANGVYAKYGVASPLSPTIRNRSKYW
jgi:hypothetical protein